MGRVLTRKNRVKKFQSEKEYFIKNGGILLEKQMALTNGEKVGGGLKIFTQEEIKKATNNYDPDLIGARLSEANIYRVMLDDRVVLIKTPKEIDDNNPQLADLFLTELSMLTVLDHENMNKAYGCCLETYIPIIVYQVTLKGGKLLHEYLHGGELVLKWKNRLMVVTQVAYALSYMHNALSNPVVHRGVKSFCVMVGPLFKVILANVAHSVSITPGKKTDNQMLPVYGTPGYIDPEYMETREVTEKCDVYSIGVLMLELLTRKDPLEMAKCGRNLVHEFVSILERNDESYFEEMIDANVLAEGNTVEIQRFVRLALKCVANIGEQRPSMIAVVEELLEMQSR